jgi:hypothetical protein
MMSVMRIGRKIIMIVLVCRTKVTDATAKVDATNVFG